MAGALGALGDELREVIADVNAGAEAALSAADAPFGKAVRILNNQMRALTSIDARTDELAAALAALQAGHRAPDAFPA